MAPRMFPGSGATLVVAKLQQEVRERENSMALLAERAKQWEAEWLQEGVEQGINQGIEQGLAQERELLRRQAEQKFDPATAEELARRLAAVTDAERLAEVGLPDHRLRYRVRNCYAERIAVSVNVAVAATSASASRTPWDRAWFSTYRIARCPMFSDSGTISTGLRRPSLQKTPRSARAQVVNQKYRPSTARSTPGIFARRGC